MARIVNRHEKGATIITHVFCFTAFDALSFALLTVSFLLVAFTIGGTKSDREEKEA